MWLRRTRSGARSRLLPYASPEFTVMLEELLVFNLLFGLLPLVIAAIMFASCGMEAARHLVDPEDDIHRLQDPSQRLGRTVEIAFGPGSSGGLCLVVQETRHGKSGWKERARRIVALGEGAAGRLRDGRVVELDLEVLVFQPELLRPAADEVRWRSTWPLDDDGRIREHCVGPGERVFVEGCLDEQHEGPARLGACGDRPAILTTGDGTPQLRIDERAAWLAGRLAMLGIAVLLVLTYLWSTLRARPLADALLRWSHNTVPGVSWKVIVGCLATPPLVLAFVAANRKLGVAFFLLDRYDYAWAVFAAAAAVGLMHVIQLRRRALAAACEPIERAATVGLRDARGDMVELAVRVRGDAPTVAGVLSGRPHAHQGLRVWRIFKPGKNHESVLDVDRCDPAHVPVEDGSGEGWLDMTHAEVDLRALRRVVRGGWAKKPKFAAALGDLPNTVSYKAFVLEERFVDRGERLYVVGAVQRLEPTTREGDYREAAAAPVVGGSPQAKLIVHAGTERSLLFGLRLERRYLDLLMAVVGAALVTVVGVTAYLISR